MNEFHIDVDSISKKPRKNGVSGMMRVKNDAEFIEACVESCIDALDELIIVYNGCTDDSPQIIESLAKKYPDKIKAYHYTPEIFAWNLTKEKAQAVLNGKIASENTLYGYYNYALSKTTYKHVMKIDADQIYFTQKLCHICDLYRVKGHSVFVYVYLLVVLVIRTYLYIAMRLKKRFSLFSNKTIWGLYISFLEKVVKSKKINVSLSGINTVICNSADVPLVSLGKEILGGNNILPPYNGEGDHPIFQVTDKTYFIPLYDKTYNSLNKLSTSVIEKLVGIGPRIPAGIYWFHLNSCRKYLLSNTIANTKRYHSSFIKLTEFLNVPLFDLIKNNSFEMVSSEKAVFFDFIHNDLDSRIIAYSSFINDMDLAPDTNDKMLRT